jgi:hypothetical protein
MKRILAAGLALLALAAWLRRPHAYFREPVAAPAPSAVSSGRLAAGSRPDTSPAWWKVVQANQSRSSLEWTPEVGRDPAPLHLEGRHTDGSCAFCDYVGAHRRAGNL